MRAYCTSGALQSFFGNTPAMICTRDAYCVAVNRAAECRPHLLCEADSLWEYMSSYDRLRFNAAANATCDGDGLVIALNGYHGFSAASVKFDKILDRRFAVVLLFKDNETALKAVKKHAAGKELEISTELISRMLSLPVAYGGDGGPGLIDLRIAAKRIIEDAVNCGVLSKSAVTVSENSEMSKCACFPVTLSLGNLMQMLSAALAAAGDICALENIDVKLCLYANEAEIRVSFDAKKLDGGIRDIDSIAEKVPSSALYLSLCRYVAGCCNCGFRALRSDDLRKLTLILTIAENVPDDLDFKSRDFLAGYDRDFADTAQIILSGKLSRTKQ